MSARIVRINFAEQWGIWSEPGGWSMRQTFKSSDQASDYIRRNWRYLRQDVWHEPRLRTDRQRGLTNKECVYLASGSEKIDAMTARVQWRLEEEADASIKNVVK